MTRASRLELSLRAEPSSVRTAREALAEAALEVGLSESVVDDLRLCVSEAVTNVVRHAYSDGVGDVLVTLEAVGDGVLVVVRDFGLGSGTHFVSRPGDEGGFGWKIIRTLTDAYTITTPHEGGTEVAMSFGAQAPGPSSALK